MSRKITTYHSFFRHAAWWLLVCICCNSQVQAQTIFRGIVINQLDSTVIPYASVKMKETDNVVLTDDKGAFQFSLPRKFKEITLTIAAIGCKTNVSYKYPFDQTVLIYLDISANTLSEVAIKALSAEEVVRIAVASIPANYADSSYFDYSFYRRYQQLNGHFVNLFEASPVVMFRISAGQHKLSANEAFAVNQLRRSTFHPDIMNALEDNPSDLLIENPIYHLASSSADPGKFNNFLFKFDTLHKSTDYVITYFSNDFTSDHHGIGDYDLRDLKPEAYETGELVIDRKTFAIKKMHRKSLRHNDYHYRFFPPQNNKLSYAYRVYFFEFIDGNLDVEYAQHKDKWYLKKICRQYTHEFYIPVFDTKEFTITDNFEWYSDSISRYTTGDYITRFYPRMATAIHSYDTAWWVKERFPFYYFSKEAVFKDLERDGPLDKQFHKESLVDEYKKPLTKKKNPAR